MNSMYHQQRNITLFLLVLSLFLVTTTMGMAQGKTKSTENTEIMGKKNLGSASDDVLDKDGKQPRMCAKEQMQADGIVRLSKIEVYPEYLAEYMEYAKEVGEVSLRTEPGVLTMYAMSEKDNPCQITILETYASQEAYRKHIASAHFQKYKQGTLKMVKSLQLSDQTPLNEANGIKNFIK